MAFAHGVAKLAGSAKLSAMIRHDAENASVTALLGPTNTGKTHLAVERMLAHRTGMMGFPLRLLAREVYDRVVEEKGEQAVALVTGEERRIPEEPRYFVCTVESMPLDRRSSSSAWTRFSWRATASAATSSPTGSCARAARRRPCSSARTPCAR